MPLCVDEQNRRIAVYIFEKDECLDSPTELAVPFALG
jgi:hypothetical protein